MALLCPLVLPTLFHKKIVLIFHRNPLLTKFTGSRRLNIGLVLFLLKMNLTNNQPYKPHARSITLLYIGPGNLSLRCGISKFVQCNFSSVTWMEFYANCKSPSRKPEQKKILLSKCCCFSLSLQDIKKFVEETTGSTRVHCYASHLSNPIPMVDVLF